jgi:hypothetical protein
MRKKISQAIEKFKIIQRIVMVLLTIALIASMCYVGYEIKIMNETIKQMNTNAQETVNAINLLQQTLKRSIWF